MSKVIDYAISKNNCYAIILAAGASKRFGKPKQLLQYQNSTLILKMCEQVHTVFEGRFTIILGAHQQKIAPSLAIFRQHIIENKEWQEGIASSIRVGVQSIPKHAQGILIVLADQVLITYQQLSMLLFEFLQHPESRIASQCNGITGVPAIFPPNDFAELLKLSGDEGAQQLLKKNENTIPVSIPEALFDIDTPNDYKKLLSFSAES